MAVSANPVVKYMKWLHTRWPAGTIEKLPAVNEDGSTNVPGMYVVGDLTGIPLLKFSSDSGARAVQTILKDPSFDKAQTDPELYDIVIIGAGVSGIAAAMEAQKAGLKYKLYEASQVFSTVVNFPKGKPIFTYPTDMRPAGDLQFTKEIKEELVEEMEAQRRKAQVEPEFIRIESVQRKGGELHAIHGGGKAKTRAKRVIIGIGRSGNFRKIGCPGEDLDKVYNRLHDPKDYAGKKAMIVGGGDSAMEAAIALACCGAEVVLSYRKKEFSRPKPENVEKLQQLKANPNSEVTINPTSERVTTAASSMMREKNVEGGTVNVIFESTVKSISEKSVTLNTPRGEEIIANDVVFPMIGREPPLDFFRRSGINIRGEWTPKTWATFAGFFSFAIFVYLWKGGTSLNNFFRNKGLFPFNLSSLFSSDPTTVNGTLGYTFTDPGFYYALAYTTAIIIFGARRIQRRKTPYVKRQTLSLIAFQIVPLFLLPYFLFPLMGAWGWFDGGIGKTIADELFPQVNYGYGREYWRAFGLILAWPLFIFNVFSDKPLWGWLAISLVQTFVLIPLLVRRWGKGAYCGWICSCGALAETMGDTHRQKMPHGPFWNKLNMIGQGILALCFIILGVRIVGWTTGAQWANSLYYGMLKGWHPFGIELNYYHVVDIGLAGIVGVGMYFHLSGRVWCRFACPLAALMHIYARFSKFRIFANKKKCISCNVCTSVCHQGIDIMNFANKGLPMEDPECVRCSACVQSCPTGVLNFGRLDANGNQISDTVAASLVQMNEKAGAPCQGSKDQMQRLG